MQVDLLVGQVPVEQLEVVPQLPVEQVEAVVPQLPVVHVLLELVVPTLLGSQGPIFWLFTQLLGPKQH